MRFNIITIFPSMFEPTLSESVLKKAQEKGLVEIVIYDLRDFTADKHRMTDDYPYGGGPGMVMKPEPIIRCVEAIRQKEGPSRVIQMSPQGRLLSQDLIKELAKEERLTIICGRYKGVDERVRELCVDDEISIGDYVLSGGEIPAMVLVDAASRMIPGVLGDDDSARGDSFFDSLLDAPQYTRPPDFRGLRVPGVLLSGHAARIEAWRRREMLRRTLERRPDLLEKVPLSEEDRRMLEEMRASSATGADREDRD